MVIARKLWKRKGAHGACLSLPEKVLEAAGFSSESVIKVTVDSAKKSITLDLMF